MDDRERIKPWQVALVLVIIGALGAVAVGWAAREVHKVDRREVEAWETQLLPRMDTVMGFHASLRALGVRATAGETEARLDPALRRVRVGLQGLRRPLQEHDYARITIPATGHYLTALGETLAALAILENALTTRTWTTERAAFDAKMAAASAAYALGEAARRDLRLRAGLERR